MEKKKKEQEAKANSYSSGIDSEQIVLNKFKNWRTDEYAQRTLTKMGYDIHQIKEVIAYIDQDEHGNRKVKLKVQLKPESSVPATNNSILKQLQDRISENENLQKILDKVLDFKDKIMHYLKK